MVRLALILSLLSIPGCASMARAQGRIWANTAPTVAYGRCQRAYDGAELAACFEGVREVER